MDKITPLASSCRIASAHDTVLNSECAYTFHNPYTTEKGILVNLSSFIGTIDKLALHGTTEEKGLFVRIAKVRVPKTPDANADTDTDAPMEGEDNNEKEPTKLGLGVEGGFQTEDDKFETQTSYSVVLLEQNANDNEITVELPYNETTKNDFPMNVSASVDSIIHHAGQAVQQDLKAFELDEEKRVSKYAATIDFIENGVTISPNPVDWKCEKSGDTENLWLNLSTGFIGGGRKNWDGSGGSNGALDHYQETGEKYPLVVKLGTITEDIDTADCYSYAKDEDGPVKIPNLAELLKKRGINISGMQKTVKSTAELEVELNATYAFDAITESGSKLVPISGPGLQGLQNLGNSCYINSVVQMLFSGTVPELASRYGTQADGDVSAHPFLNIPPRDVSDDILAQTAKLSCALTSGTFAPPNIDPVPGVTDDASSSNDPKYRLPPRMFKHVVGRDHVDFCTGQQQDAAQFLQYMLEKLDSAEKGSSARVVNKSNAVEAAPTTSNLFSFETTSRMVCSQDGKIKYKKNNADTMWSLRVPMDKAEPTSSTMRSSMSSDSEPEEKKQKPSEEEKEPEIPTVSLKTCIESWSNPPPIHDFRWKHLNNTCSPTTQQIKFANFPRYLIIQIQRYELGPDWTPRKLEVNITVPDELDLNSSKCQGPQEGEDIVPDDDDDDSGNDARAPSNASPQVQIDEEALGQLMDMGFGMNGCKRALNAVGGSNVEMAMNWIFEHNSDPDFNDPLPEPDSNPGSAAPADAGSTVDEGKVASLVENLGCFNADQVRAALKECNGSADRAADWLFSHMDDLEGAIAKLQSNSSGAAASSTSTSPPTPVEDGDGKYKLVGLVSHIGKNTGSGHYVAHLKKNDKWVIFNDEKVAISEHPPTPHAYLYLFQRSDSAGSPNTSY